MQACASVRSCATPRPTQACTPTNGLFFLQSNKVITLLFMQCCAVTSHFTVRVLNVSGATCLASAAFEHLGVFRRVCARARQVRQGLVWVWAGGGGAAAAAKAAATPPVLAHELDQEAEGLPTRTRDGHPATARTYHYRELCARPARRQAQLLLVHRLFRGTACLPLVMCPASWPLHEKNLQSLPCCACAPV